MATVISDCADGIGTTELRDAVATLRVVQSCRWPSVPSGEGRCSSSPSIDRTCEDDPQEEVSRVWPPRRSRWPFAALMFLRPSEWALHYHVSVSQSGRAISHV